MYDIEDYGRCPTDITYNNVVIHNLPPSFSHLVVLVLLVIIVRVVEVVVVVEVVAVVVVPDNGNDFNDILLRTLTYTNILH